MGTWLGRITCVNYYRRAIGFKAEMDRMGTDAETQTYNVEGKIPFTRNIFSQTIVQIKKKTKYNTVV